MKTSKKKLLYWDIKPIKAIPAQYRMIFGERSNGKTYGTLDDAIKECHKRGKQFAYLRRWPEDVRKAKMLNLFSALTKDNRISEATNGEWNGITFGLGQFNLIATDNDGAKVVCEKPIGYAFAITAMEHSKSLSYPDVQIIIFDEFISRTNYAPDEFVTFMNVLSTIIRDRDDVEIWMLGNTVSKDCPYFREMGLRHVLEQKQGTIDTYTYEKDGQELMIAVEYTKNLASKKSDKYFIFDNPKMQMITGGAWELAMYPHLFERYKPKQIIYTFFIVYRSTTLQCEVVEGKNGIFIYIHQKTTELQDRETDLVYSVEPSNKPNWRVNLTAPLYPIEQKLVSLIRNERTCFQDNEVGEVFNDYLKWCRQHSVIKN